MAEQEHAPSLVTWVLEAEAEDKPSEQPATNEPPPTTESKAVDEAPSTSAEEQHTRAIDEVVALLEGHDGLQVLAKHGFDVNELREDEDYEMTLLELAGDDAYSFADVNG